MNNSQKFHVESTIEKGVLRAFDQIEAYRQGELLKPSEIKSVLDDWDLGDYWKDYWLEDGEIPEGDWY